MYIIKFNKKDGSVGYQLVVIDCNESTRRSRRYLTENQAILLCKHLGVKIVETCLDKKVYTYNQDKDTIEPNESEVK